MTSGTAPQTGQTFEEVRRAMAGSQGAFEALYRRFRGRLEIRFSAWIASSARFNRRLSRRIQVDDVVQATLVRAYRDLGQLGDVRPGSFWKWLCVVGWNTMMDAIRRATTKGAACSTKSVGVL